MQNCYVPLVLSRYLIIKLSCLLILFECYLIIILICLIIMFEHYLIIILSCLLMMFERQFERYLIIMFIACFSIVFSRGTTRDPLISAVRLHTILRCLL